MVRLRAGGWATALAVLLVVLAGLLHGVFVPGQVLFANDGSLGQQMADCHRLPARFAGCWGDLNGLGANNGIATPSISTGLRWLLGPVGSSKFYAIISLLILGLGAWCFFRESKLSPLACILGGLAVVLNSTFFSVACWGMGAHDITFGMIFFALAALADTSSPQRWLRVILAGMAVGMAVTEGADVGAIFSLGVAAFLLYQIWTVEGPRAKSLAAGAGRLLLVVVFAGFLAAQAVQGLVGSSIEGVAGTGQDAQTKMQRWDWATQWSLPKVEALNLVVPGLFGYRSDTPNGGTYWGTRGRDPAWYAYDRNGRQGPPPTGFLRYSGGGNYAGGLVVLVALWAALQALRRTNSPFNLAQRKWLWFWLGAAVLSLLLAFGRFAPFYQLVYALPYASTIRNPIKFIYVFSFALVVLFAFGVDGLCRRYLSPAVAGAPSRWAGLQYWWNRAAKFEKRWVYGCGVVWLASLLAWWDYAAHREELVEYLQGALISAPPDMVAAFSIQQAGWFVVAFALAAGLMILIFSGAFAGRRAAQGGILLAVLLAGDLGLANRPWIVYWDYVDKYSSNPVLDLMRDKPWEHRVVSAPLSGAPELARLSSLYRKEWLQQQFPYYDIQSLDTIEMPRIQEDYHAFMSAFNDTNAANPWFRLARAWQVTASRYLLAPVNFADFLSAQDMLAPVRLQLLAQFGLAPKPGVVAVTQWSQLTAVLASNGRFGLFEYLGALPRAKLYSRWQAATNDAAVLKALLDPDFDPASSVFVAGDAPASPAAETSPSPGSVEFVHYAPKEIVLQADAAAPSVLLLNDHFDPDWKVFVDGQPERLLRCNFLMRGVHLAAGTHRVVFKFQPPLGWLYVSLAAVTTALVVLVVFMIWVAKSRALVPAAAVAPAPVAVAQIKDQSTPAVRPAPAGRRVPKR